MIRSVVLVIISACCFEIQWAETQAAQSKSWRCTV